MAQLLCVNVVSEHLTGAACCAEWSGEVSPQYEMNGLYYLSETNNKAHITAGFIN